MLDRLNFIQGPSLQATPLWLLSHNDKSAVLSLLNLAVSVTAVSVAAVWQGQEAA